MVDLEHLIKDDSFLSFDADCVRKRSNWSKSSDKYKFDSENFDPTALLNDIHDHSPKLHALLQKIDQLDRADMRSDGHMYKHFIFCDLKSSTYGAKLLASALIAKGMILGYNAPKRGAKSPSPKSPKPKVVIIKKRKDTPIVTDSIKSPLPKPALMSQISEGEEEEEEPEEEQLEEEPEEEQLEEEQLEEEPEEEQLEEEPEEEQLEEEQLEEEPEEPVVEETPLEQEGEEMNEESEESTPESEESSPESEESSPESEESLSDESEANSPESKGGAKTAQAKMAKREPAKKEPAKREPAKREPVKNKKIYGKLNILDDATLRKTKNQNFYLLSSVSVFDQPISVANKKQILLKFNQRPDNVLGEEARIIIMDSGFKEGIDLFDIKYIHIFEPPVNAADQKQVIGRGTRTCGQKGLIFHPTKGWPLHVFIYDLEIPEQMRKSFMGVDTAFDLYLKALNLDIRLFRFAADLEETSVYGSVDYELNRAIHQFAINNGAESPGSPESPKSPNNRSRSKGGGRKKADGVIKPRIKIDRTQPPIMINTKGNGMAFVGNQSPPMQVQLPSGAFVPGIELKQMNFNEMRKYVRDYFGDMAWTNIQMENLCAPKKGGASELIKYTPTQDFIRRFFTPQTPVKGMLLWHSVGTGKTCSAIAAATASFEPQNYTILWVTRTTLKNDIWKNMFDQICNETIRRMVEQEGLSIPDAQEKRMRLLSKAWTIRPMSYKQFSNLVSKENNFYKTLVKINGPADPLRKTLLIIDEAHKLYGGGDLSSLERPDMKALHSALMNSYAISGADSVKLLLMTATPITENPMELIKLVNLCKTADQQMPNEFPLFSQEFLNEEGGFTAEGRRKYLDCIAGHISYLNREKDARQFAQPRVQMIRAPIIRDVQDAMNMDKRFVRSVLNGEVDAIKNRIQEENDKMDKDLKDLDASRFYGLRDYCDTIEDKASNKRCLKVANANIRELVREAKSYTHDIKSSIKAIREEVKNKKIYRNDALKQISERLKDRPEDLEKFKDSMYYSLKYKCGKKVTPNATLKEASETHPELMEINQAIDAYDERIANLENGLKEQLIAHQARMKSITQMLRVGDLSELERSVLKMTLKDVRKTFNKTSKEARKQVDADRIDFQKTRRNLEKERKKRFSVLKKSVKAQVRETQSEAKDAERAERKLKKTLRKQGEIREEIKTGILRELMDKYSAKVATDFKDVNSAMEHKVKEKAEEKQRKAEQKAEEKQRKAEQKAEEKHRKTEKKAEEKHRKTEKKTEEKAEKKAAAQELKMEIKRLKLETKALEKKEREIQKREEKEARKTKKNK